MKKPASIALLVALLVLAYVGLCSVQIFIIQERVGLAIPYTTVLASTVKLMFTGGPWVPFIMTPSLPQN